MQRKSAYIPSYQNWPQATGLLLWGSARPMFLGGMCTGAVAVEFSASGESAWWAVYRPDGCLIDKDRYATSGTANKDRWIPVLHQKNDAEHHLTALPSRLHDMSGIEK